MHSVVQLEECICNLVQNRKIIICLRMSVINAVANKIGDPQKVDGDPQGLQQRFDEVAPRQPQPQVSPFTLPPARPLIMLFRNKSGVVVTLRDASAAFQDMLQLRLSS